MEERLDDAINVLRNHAEPQIGLGQIPTNLVPPQMTNIAYVAPETHISDPVKIERATYNTSELLCPSVDKEVFSYCDCSNGLTYSVRH